MFAEKVKRRCPESKRRCPESPDGPLSPRGPRPRPLGPYEPNAPHNAGAGRAGPSQHHLTPAEVDELQFNQDPAPAANLGGQPGLGWLAGGPGQRLTKGGRPTLGAYQPEATSAGTAWLPWQCPGLRQIDQCPAGAGSAGHPQAPTEANCHRDRDWPGQWRMGSSGLGGPAARAVGPQGAAPAKCGAWLHWGSPMGTWRRLHFRSAGLRAPSSSVLGPGPGSACWFSFSAPWSSQPAGVPGLGGLGRMARPARLMRAARRWARGAAGHRDLAAQPVRSPPS